jgi:hypothetical protein
MSVFKRQKAANTVWCVLKVIVCLLVQVPRQHGVQVQSWEGSGRQVAGNRCIWVTGCAEALYPPEEGVQNSSP